MNRAAQHESYPLQATIGSLNAPSSRIIAIISQSLAAVTILIAVIASIGWLTENQVLSAFGETFYPMAPRTAFVFLFYGTALILISRNSQRYLYVSTLLITIGFTFAISRLAEHLMGISVGIIEQFLPSKIHDSVTIPTGRMALATAFCLMIGGASLFLLLETSAVKWRRYLAGGLAVSMTAVPLIFLLGYAYRAPLDYNGTAIPMALNTSLAFTTLGIGIVIIGIGFEIAEKRNTTAITNFLATMVKSSNDAIIGINPDKIIIWWNDGAEQMFGYTAQEAIGNTWKLIAYGDTFEEQSKTQAYLLRGGSVQHLELMLRHKNGYQIEADVSAFPLLDADGNVYAMTGICRNISERKKLERERQTAQTRLEALMDNTAAIVFLKDTEGRFLMVNRRYEETLAIAPGSMTGKTDFDFFPQTTAERFRSRDQAVMVAGTWFECEETLELQDGTHTYLGNIFALLDDSGKSYGVGGIITDITERKINENKIAELNSALTQKTEALEAANKELESFSYSVSHDLRAPLRSVSGFSQVIQEDYAATLDDRGKDYLARVRKAADEMGILIDDILALSRVTRREMKPEWVNMSALAEEVLNHLKKAHPERNVEFEILPGLRAAGDRQLLRIVFENLLGNAWKYTGRRTDARIEFGVTTLDNGEEAFFVRDNGAGFDMQYAHKLFGAFQRLHHTDEFEGTGIGLATVQRIIRRHGGRIWAEGKVDSGAVFHFTLPYKEAPAHAEATYIAR